MTLTCQLDDFTQTDKGELVTFASDLGLPPGTWPQEIKVSDRTITFSASLSNFVRDGDGDVQYADYVGFGPLVRIFND